MSHITSSIDGIMVKLSNLEKMLWPQDGISKAELIQYYLDVYEYMIAFLQYRPLTMIRFPDGIDGNKFYSKNAPDFTPSWIEKSMVSGIEYIIAKKKSDLVYLANLAALEIHAMNVTAQHVFNADTMIFDLDPSHEIGFDTIRETCAQLCQLLKDHDYFPFVKTSGSKGLHIYVPVHPSYTIEDTFLAAKDIGQQYIGQHKHATLKISKEKREGKILIDIYRNHQGQTCITPLSTRARPHAPVSMPVNIEDLHSLTSADQYTIHNALPYLKEKLPWKNFNAFRAPLHLKKNIYTSTIPLLNDYANKRNFDATTEPTPEITQPTSNAYRYVIQLHDATNLHYDLRLEENGVLLSWAIPKNLPLKKGVKRLAIRTEDHPLSYLFFEGTIPKGEYGGGTMWIFESGKYSLVEKKQHSYIFILSNGQQNNTYKLYQVKDEQWFIELMSDEIKFANPGIMLAEQVNQVPNASDYVFELKWDGIRVTIIKDGMYLMIFSKSDRDISKQFPDIISQAKAIDAEYAILDGELVCLDEKGIPVFANIISRLHSKNQSVIDYAAKSLSAVLYLFDIKNLDGKWCMDMPIEKRKEWLTHVVKVNNQIRISEIFEDGQALFTAIKSMGLEGIMAKRKKSKYINQRSKEWLKIKSRSIIDAIVIGYTKGNGDRASTLGALHIGRYEDGKIIYLGKVGTGFDEQKLNELILLLHKSTIVTKPIREVVEEEYNTVWIKDGPECEIQYASLTPNGTLREAVFHRLKTEE